MLDARFVNENQDLVVANLRRRHAEIDLTPLLADSERRRALVTEVESLQAQRNEASQRIGALKKKGEDTADAQEAVRDLGQKIKDLDAERGEVEARIDDFLLRIPNMLHESVPDGASEADNIEVREWGHPPHFDFEVKDHVAVAEGLGILDLERAAKLSGARFSLLKGDGARLERALATFMLDLHTQQHGYTEFIPPYLVTRQTLTGTGQLPKFEADVFRCEFGERELFMIPTAEVPLTNLHRDEILEEAQLPLYYTAFTPCFRSEAGSYGKDVRGLIRQHQFHKVELVKFAHPDSSMDELEKMTQNAERVLQLLGLPYRVVALCSADIGFGAVKTYDIEVWLPAQNTYREISSCSNCGDFQARRANIRFRPAPDGKKKVKPQFVHTLNGSGLAVGRTLIAVLENYQQADGTVIVPLALRPYLGGQERIQVR